MKRLWQRLRPRFFLRGAARIGLKAMRATALCGAMGLLAFSAFAEIPVPDLHARVTDLTGTLAPGEVAALEQKLAAFEQRKGAQVAVLIIATTEPETIEQFGIRAVEAWKLGRKGVDDGALLLIAKDDRTLRIEVGYGLEGALPDATAKRIIDEVIVPRFRSGDFYGGVDVGVDRIVSVIDGEPLPEPAVARRGGRSRDTVTGILPVLFIFTVTFGAILKRLMGQLPGALVTGGIAGVLAWFFVGMASIGLLAALVAFVLTLLSYGGPGGWSSGRGGMGWGGGGFGGGGFGGGGFGGGGGGFGGGGSSGRW